MSSLLLLNASPRGTTSNSARMLAPIAEGWKTADGDEPTVLHLARRTDFQRALAEFGSADTVLLGTPLYTDSMPGLVLEFIEALESRVGRQDNPRLAFLVQSGLTEAAHSRGLERYFAKLSVRFGSRYAGTIVRGGSEGLQQMPDQMLKGLFGKLRALGGQLMRDGRFDAETLAQIAGKERHSPAMAVVAKVVTKVPLTQFYWNGMLKKNGVWDKRFDAPYAKGYAR
jgi:multimeric flavodoxin WrbA